MRVVLDTNILARAVASRSSPASEVFERIAANHVLVASLELLAELARVLGYDRVRRLHQLSNAAIAELIESIESGATIVPLASPLPRIVPGDAADDMVVATAIGGRSDVLCTRDRHLFDATVIAYCRQHAIEILDDIALVARLRASEL